MISRLQIKAARSLLEWDADELAHKSGLSRDTIFNIESGRTRARDTSLHVIARVFEEHGVEFTDNHGVRLKPHNIETLEGREGFTRFYEIIHEYLRLSGGDVCVSGVDERLFTKYRDNPEVHRARMVEVMRQHPDFMMRILIKEGDTNFVASQYATYKWQPKESFSATAFYVFGDCLALISFTHDPAPLIILIKSAAFSEAYRHSFNLAWANSKIPNAES